MFGRNKRKYKRETRKKPLVNFESVKRFSLRSTLGKIHGEPNRALIVLVLGLLFCGALMILSASVIAAYNDSKVGDSLFYFKKQLLWVFLGILAAYVLYLFPLDKLKKLSPFILAIGLFLMAIMLIEIVFKIDLPFVLEKNGAIRWIDLGIIELQPSEIVKFGVIAYVSGWLAKEDKAKRPKNMSIIRYHIYYTFLPFTFLLGVISSFILAQRDLDTVVILVLSVMTVYYVSGNNKFHNLGTIFLFIAGTITGIIALLFEPYRRERVLSFWDILTKGEPSTEQSLAASFQVWSGIIGLGSGWLFGKGYSLSVAKQGFLQEAAYTDSIFVVIGEEFGLVGAVLVITAFLFFASLGYSIATSANDKFSMLIATGMTSWIVIQAYLNIAANLAVIPFGGMPLPFFSYGGSSTITIMMAIGIILNVSKNSKNLAIRRPKR